MNVIGVDAPQFGVLIAVQEETAMIVYIPSARIAEYTGKKPFVIATFCCSALMPLAVNLARSFGSLVIAFVIGGLREIGEPARKALIIDLAAAKLRARVVGMYYLVRSLAITPAAFIGGLLWRISPQIPFYVAASIGAIGAVVFARTVDENAM